MKNKPIKFIIPQIHNLNDCWFIQWWGNEYYIQKNKLKIAIKKIFDKYSLINFLLLISIMIISNVFPVENFEDFFQNDTYIFNDWHAERYRHNRGQGK